MLERKFAKSMIAALILCLHIVTACHAAEIAGTAAQNVQSDHQQVENGDQQLAPEDDQSDYPLKAEFELEKPLLPVPLAEEMPGTTPRIRKPAAKPQLKNQYRYYYTSYEFEENRTVKRLLEEMNSWHYAPKKPESEFTCQAMYRYLPNRHISELTDMKALMFPPDQREAESEAAHLNAVRETAIRDACRNNLQLIAEAVDRYFRDHPDEIIRVFDQDDVTSPNGRFVKDGYLKEPIKIPEGCRYVNEYRLSELISGAQVYCTRHDNQ
ncbi:MAG: hypothetical protein ACD_39C01801G0002 [uncultured bacterium]|nr:MAG: hypothetical protein ACD_39C01801G0002 [uncultured bacterium]